MRCGPPLRPGSHRQGLPDNSACHSRVFARLSRPTNPSDNHYTGQFGSAVGAIAVPGKLLVASGDDHESNGAAGAVNPRHRHQASEQVWVALEGSGILLLDDERTEPFTAGDVVRFADGDLHGFRNDKDMPFVYLSVTAPPVNFREAYAKDWSRTV
jgi:mannose-6-phosphate isomerase-like protein (cupin superfamily)